MTDLQKLAINRVKDLASSIEPATASKPFKYSSEGELTTEELDKAWENAKERTYASMNDTREKQREIEKWANALLDG